MSETTAAAARALIADLASCDAAAVSGFLTKHRKELSSRAVREVSNKMRIGLKNPRPARRRN
jgi:hypothetical protein